ncbi:[FeFe] hydrogenase H-cluster maturation GTPase HydF [uncultured Slackia sp.]|uniref:[FeFe] hydrogenase H-cluster maturation GTPase HydF n=1 Tax=uncultured Slackia sp. TaxID=665903 RepID=UPI0025EA7154|nr:[FeFe] hydrogenase H-cluster maturation GTPase HydF [uncultured Slackia sp.]
MGLNETPSGERVRIGFFGVRNAGKSSLVNAVCGQQVALASDVAGTTTDPVKKAMELLPLGPVDVIDTPGIDDEGDLGERRVSRAREVLRTCDVAVLVTDATREPVEAERELAALFAERGLPCVIARNKLDLLGDAPAGCGCAVDGGQDGASPRNADPAAFAPCVELLVSARTGQGVRELKEAIARLGSAAVSERRVVADLLAPGDRVVLVVPIDSSAPKGRIILPQQLVLRDVLDAHASAVVCQPEELDGVLASVGDVRLVITDSQVFGKVSRIVPEACPLTSFSILMARYKGNLRTLIEGASALGALTDESRVLISEGCTHHRQCEDIGTVKMPAWIRQHCGASPSFEFTQGNDFPEDVSGYDVVVHCGACVLNGKEMQRRQSAAAASGTPMVNYGVAIACMHGILERSLQPLRGFGI